MRYVKFTFENYKGIKNKLEFCLDSNAKVPHCIVGNNESGKTTLLKGISLIGQLCEGENSINGTRNAIKPKGNYFTGTVALGATIITTKSEIKDNIKKSKLKVLKSLKDLLKDNDINVELEFSYDFKNASFVQNSNKKLIKINNNEVKKEEDKALIFTLIKSYAPSIMYYDDFKFAVPKRIRFLKTGTQAEDKKLLEESNNQYWQGVLNDILKGHDEKANSFQNDIVDWSLNPNNDQSIPADRLRNMSKYLNTILKEWIKNKDSNIESFELSKYSSDLPGDSMFNDYQIKVLSGANSYDMHERSKGLQWSFCFHVFTQIRQNRHSAGFIFLLDEPANNLHVSPQREMLEHLKALCDKENNAVIYSTHAPDLIGIKEEYYNTHL